MNDFWSNFSVNFWANLAADALIAIMFGVLVAWWITRKINKLERQEEEKERISDEIIKSLSLLSAFRKDVNRLIPEIDKWINQHGEMIKEEKAYEPLTLGPVSYIDISLWEVYKSGGELPKFLPAHLIKLLSNFYNELSIFNRSIEGALSSWVVKHDPPLMIKVRRFNEMALESLKRADKVSCNLLEELENEIETKDIELSRLNKYGTPYQKPDEEPEYEGGVYGLRKNV